MHIDQCYSLVHPCVTYFVNCEWIVVIISYLNITDQVHHDTSIGLKLIHTYQYLENFCKCLCFQCKFMNLVYWLQLKICSLCRGAFATWASHIESKISFSILPVCMLHNKLCAIWTFLVYTHWHLDELKLERSEICCLLISFLQQ